MRYPETSHLRSREMKSRRCAAQCSLASTSRAISTWSPKILHSLPKARLPRLPAPGRAFQFPPSIRSSHSRPLLSPPLSLPCGKDVVGGRVRWRFLARSRDTKLSFFFSFFKRRTIYEAIRSPGIHNRGILPEHRFGRKRRCRFVRSISSHCICTKVSRLSDERRRITYGAYHRGRENRINQKTMTMPRRRLPIVDIDRYIGML